MGGRLRWFWSRVRASFRWTWRDRWCALEACAVLGLARVAILLVPFRHLAPALGQRTGGSTETPCDDPLLAQRVTLAIRRAARVAPWGRNCLAQAIAGQLMLRRRGVRTTLYLGVKKQGHQVEAHAWLRAGDLVVTGGPGHTDYTPISSFGANRP